MNGCLAVRRYAMSGAEGGMALGVSTCNERGASLTYQKKARQNSGGSQTRSDCMLSPRPLPPVSVAGGRAPTAERIERLLLASR